MPQIESRSNSKFKDLKKQINLNDDFIFIEGKKILSEAISSSVAIQEVIVDEKNTSMVEELNLPESTTITYLNNELIADLYTTKHKPDGDSLICAVAKKVNYSIENILSSNKPLIYLDGVQDPNNLGLIARMCLAFDAGGIFLSDGSVNPFNTKVIRSSAGYIFKLPVFKINSFDNFASEVKKHDYKLVATSLKADKYINEIPKTKTVFIFGSEGNGVTEEVLRKADDVVKIKHSDNVESLNVAFSTGIVLYEFFEK